ncbi:hypothetical protein BC827DRAFT_56022 [Russula dissimulans]|nr:hypothetical protein BC827DRAFT_56022 [Russula dissimulans]
MSAILYSSHEETQRSGKARWSSMNPKGRKKNTGWVRSLADQNVVSPPLCSSSGELPRLLASCAKRNFTPQASSPASSSCLVLTHRLQGASRARAITGVEPPISYTLERACGPFRRAPRHLPPRFATASFTIGRTPGAGRDGKKENDNRIPLINLNAGKLSGTYPPQPQPSIKKNPACMPDQERRWALSTELAPLWRCRYVPLGSKEHKMRLGLVTNGAA